VQDMTLHKCVRTQLLTRQFGYKDFCCTQGIPE
jgi:hypothetical protein